MEEDRVNLHEYYAKYNLASKFLLPSLLLDDRIVSFDKLKLLGFIGVFLYDETEGNVRYFPNSLLIILNPSVSFKELHWESVLELFKKYPNFIEYIEYDEYIYGIWFKIHDKFGNNLRNLFKLGKYSEFPASYIMFLTENAKKVCKQDAGLQKEKEKELGLEEGDLNGAELASIPNREDYVFKYLIWTKVK